MRSAGIIVFGVFALAALWYSQFASATQTAKHEIVPQQPVVASCSVRNGHTVITVSSEVQLSNLAVSVGNGRVVVFKDLLPGWSVSRSISGIYQSAVVSYIWRGSSQRIPVACS